MLDRLIWAISRGLGYKQSMLCLVDRKQGRLEVKRDSGLGKILNIAGQRITGKESIAEFVRRGREVFVEDISRDPIFKTDFD